MAPRPPEQGAPHQLPGALASFPALQFASIHMHTGTCTSRQEWEWVGGGMCLVLMPC